MLHSFIVLSHFDLFLSLRTVYCCSLTDGARRISGSKEESPKLPSPQGPCRLNNPSLNTTAGPPSRHISLVLTSARIQFHFLHFILAIVSSFLFMSLFYTESRRRQGGFLTASLDGLSCLLACHLQPFGDCAFSVSEKTNSYAFRTEPTEL